MLSKQDPIRIGLSLALIALLLGAAMEVYDDPNSFRVVCLGFIIGFITARLVQVSVRQQRNA